VGQSLAWARGAIAAGAAVIGLAGRDPGAGQWYGLAVAVGGFMAAAGLISGLLKATPGVASVARQYTNTLPALAAFLAILTCTMLALFAPVNIEGAALGLLSVFAALAARLSLTIAYRDLQLVEFSNSAAYGIQALAYAWLTIAFLSPAEERMGMGLLAGSLIALTLAWAMAQRVANHSELVKGQSLVTCLPTQQQIDQFLSDYFRHKQPEGVILLKFAIAGFDKHDAPDASTEAMRLFADVGSVLQVNFRADDFVAATAEWQFLVACPGLQPDIAQALAERACQAVQRTAFHNSDQQLIPVRLMVGASSICESLPECERGWQQAEIELLGMQQATAQA